LSAFMVVSPIFLTLTAHIITFQFHGLLKRILHFIFLSATCQQSTPWENFLGGQQLEKFDFLLFVFAIIWCFVSKSDGVDSLDSWIVVISNWHFMIFCTV